MEPGSTRLALISPSTVRKQLMSKIKKGQKGLSLMEALVAMLVASIVLAAGRPRGDQQHPERSQLVRNWNARGRCSTAHRHGLHEITIGLCGRSLLPEKPRFPGEPHVSL